MTLIHLQLEKAQPYLIQSFTFEIHIISYLVTDSNKQPVTVNMHFPLSRVVTKGKLK